MNNNTGRKRVRRARKNESIKRILLTVCMMAMVAAISIGGTIAWLTDTTDSVENVFSTSHVDITLEETDAEYKMIPGGTIDKDPTVTVYLGSEASYVFVKVEKSANYDDYLESYVMAEDWIELETGVYYQLVDDMTEATENTVLQVLKDDQVKVLTTVTNAMMTEAEGNAPTLTFTAYAIQQFGMEGPADAWSKVKDTTEVYPVPAA